MHAYALLTQPQHDFQLPDGIAGPLTLVSQGSLAAVIEPDLDITEWQADETKLLHAILSHDRVIHALFQQTPILPLRFAVFPAQADLIAHLATHQTHYLAQLERLAGYAEHPVKLLPLAAAIPAIAPDLRGKAYFLAKKQYHLAQEHYQQRQQAELALIKHTLANQYPIQTTDDDQRLHILVHSAQRHQVASAIAQLQNQYPTWAIQLGEPLAPFHFVQPIS